MKSNVPTELARSALKRIVELGLSPTPEHFSRFYREAEDMATGWVPESMTAVEPSPSMLQRFDALVSRAVSTTEQLSSGLDRQDEALNTSLEDILANQPSVGTARLVREAAGLARDIRVTVKASQAELLDTQRSLVELQTELLESRKLLGQDPLTGTDNRRSMESILAREIARSRRDSEPLTVVMVDIDHFKQVNDSHGHAAGDAALVHMTRLARALLRGNDAFIRYGGEEFLLVLPETSLHGGLSAGRRLRDVLKRQPLVYEGKTITNTISGGVATLCAEDTAESLVRRADTALYEAKRTGRDRIVSS